MDRSDSSKPTMGLTTWKDAPDGKILKRDVLVAKNYLNEKEIGKALQKSQIPRKELFITTKVWVQDTGYEKDNESFPDIFQKNLGLDYIDLYLIHQPYGDYYGSWKAMEELYQQGKIKAIWCL